jgi:hypothetical protein
MSANELYQAAGRGDINAVQRLLDAGVNPNDLIAAGATQTPIYGAVRHLDILGLLIGRGANPALGSDEGGSLLDRSRRVTSQGAVCMSGGEPTKDPNACTSFIEQIFQEKKAADQELFRAQEKAFMAAQAEAAQAASAANAAAANAAAAQAASAANAAAANAAAANAAAANAAAANAEANIPNNSSETLTEANANTGTNQSGATVAHADSGANENGAAVGGRHARLRRKTRRRCRKARRKSYRRKRR